MKKILIGLLFFVGLTSTTIADNNPVYDDEIDLQYAILDIPNSHATQCQITLTEETKNKKTITHAEFKCDYSNFQEGRKLSMIGMSSKDLISFIKKQYSAFKVLDSFKQYSIKGGTLLLGKLKKSSDSLM